MRFLRSFRSRVEQKIVLLVIVFGVLPMGLVSFLALQEIESQTLVLAEKQLRDMTKTYALDLLDQLDHASWEIQILRSGESEQSGTGLVRAIFAAGAPNGSARSLLATEGDRMLMTVARDDETLVGEIPLGRLFEGLGHLPVGVRRCIQFDGNDYRCAGSEVGDDYIESSWKLPLSSVYDTEVALDVVSRQSLAAALAHVSLVSELLPLSLMLLATLISWVLIVLIRRRIAPLSDLEAATILIREGDYGTRVQIGTHDEFERLGDAFNLMTARLGRSFEKMGGLAEIDRMVLAGSNVDEIIEQALQMANGYYGRTCYVYRWAEHRKQGCLYELDGDGLKTTRLCLLAGPGIDRADVDHMEALAAVLGVGIGCSYPIRVDRETRGELFVTRDGSEADGDFTTLEELADRISVADTNFVRAQSLYEQANYDSLTGLINRQAFSDRVAEAIERAERHRDRGAVLFLDLDRFKQVNDTEGHLVGDELLRLVGQRLADEVRGSDTVARLGGDEFAVIVPECGSNADLAILCRRLIDVVNQPIEIDRLRHEIDVSIGVSIFPDDGTDTGTLLMKADVAMYEAKSLGGSTSSFYDSALNAQNERRVLIESGLRDALADGSLKLYYQPKLDLATMRVQGLEGLLRWRDGAEMRFNPAEFIPVAEETGLIHRFTELLVGEAAECVRHCRAAGLDVGRIAINISTRQFVRQGFAGEFLKTLGAAGLAPNEVEIEVTESLFIEDAAHVVRELQLLRDADVHIALDDFGTGYSSLNMLRSLPLNTVKIDRSFIAPLRDAADARKVAQKIIEMVSALDLTVVAEGVEHWQEVALLERLGCHAIQGFVLAAPLPLDALIPYLLRIRDEGIRAEYRVVGTS